ncbi:phosphofructokinase, putative [Bodo saltans]|uniref:Phosphofructokinase, putative n=1 Tax=Bodo saltans TaxID=75058 RepID=A0A0S4JJJ5_BODSA|nr:phosphofructokinase, putative [Bodo saltans]|eukprot:CUG91688.1 phosphofructokinase, putative [Bodo saltans]
MSSPPTTKKPSSSPTSTAAPIVVALLTSGRIAPSFGPAVGGFLRRYQDLVLGDAQAAQTTPQQGIKFIVYRHGYRGLLTGDTVEVKAEDFAASEVFSKNGGSPAGASRTRLSNVPHLLKRGFIKEGDDPHELAAQQLMKDNVRVLHVIGSASAQFTASRLSALLNGKYHYPLHHVGLAKTIENDMSPIRMTLGALTAAEEGAKFFENVVAEHNSNPRMLIIHEIKGRAAGWLAAATAREYRKRLDHRNFASSFGQAREVLEVHAVYTPEMHIDFPSEIGRLRRCMDRHDNVNIFVAQGTLLSVIEAELAAEQGGDVARHPAFGYPIIDTAAWFAKKLKDGIGAEKVLIQRSGVYVRAAPANNADRMLTTSCVNYAVDLVVSHVIEGRPITGSTSSASSSRAAQSTKSNVLRGVVGHDDRFDGQLRLVEVEPLMRKWPFDVAVPWFVELLAAIGQPQESAGHLRKRREIEGKQQRTTSATKSSVKSRL